MPPDYAFLRELAGETDGAFLTRPEESFLHDLRLAGSAQPAWPYPIAALVPLFLLDVAIRRLRFGPDDLRPALVWLRSRWQGRTGQASVIAGRLAAAARATPPTTPRSGPRPAPTFSRAARGPARQPPPPLPSARAGLPPGNRLLAAKRRATPAPPAVRR